MTNEEIVEILNYHLEEEIRAILQYLQHAYMARGVDRLPIYEFMEKASIGEMKHVEILAKKVVAFGGVPSMRAKNIDSSPDIKDMLRADIALEEEAVRKYSEDVAKLDAAGQIALKVIFENLVEDEQEHLDELRILLGE